jgi:DNA-binding MarR family transcriptional regulator
MPRKVRPTRELTPAEYQALGAFRHQIRLFLHFSEQAAKAEDLEPQQHQMLLAIRACGGPFAPTVGTLAENLLIRHHSAVGLLDRLAEQGLVERVKSLVDGRQVSVSLTPKGETKLRRLSGAHREELRRAGPVLVAALASLLRQGERHKAPGAAERD